MKKIAVIGLGRFGTALLEELSKTDVDIIAIDCDEEAVDNCKNLTQKLRICDSTNEEALQAAGINEEFSAVICYGDNLEATILTMSALKNIGVNTITVRCDKDSYIRILEKYGATDFISPQKLAGTRLARRMASDNISDYFKLSGEYNISEVVCPSSMKEILISELGSRKIYKVNIVLIKRGNHSFAPAALDVIKPNDVLFVCGTDMNVNKFSTDIRMRG